MLLMKNSSNHKDLDGTPFQCDCYTRGEEHCIEIFIQHVNEILDGKDDGRGANREPWGSLRQRLLKLVQDGE